MSSGSWPPERRSARLRDFPPTISGVISSLDTTHLPHQLRFLMAMPRDPGVTAAAACAASPPPCPSWLASPFSTTRSVPRGLSRSASPCRPWRDLKVSASKHDPKHTCRPPQPPKLKSATPYYSTRHYSKRRRSPAGRCAPCTSAPALTFSLRARTDTWDSTSGMSGVSSATTPSGISSSPVTRLATSTVGRSYTSFCTSDSRATTSTNPCASTGLITCTTPRQTPVSSHPGTTSAARVPVVGGLDASGRSSVGLGRLASAQRGCLEYRASDWAAVAHLPGAEVRRLAQHGVELVEQDAERRRPPPANHLLCEHRLHVAVRVEAVPDGIGQRLEAPVVALARCLQGPADAVHHRLRPQRPRLPACALRRRLPSHHPTASPLQ
eukprot:389952-Prorocentrum_minimum.AAC.2